MRNFAATERTRLKQQFEAVRLASIARDGTLKGGTEMFLVIVGVIGQVSTNVV